VVPAESLFTVAGGGAGGMAYGLTVDTTGNMPIWWMLLLFGLGLFTCCMVLHGELARLKPDPQYLTHFYLTISAAARWAGSSWGCSRRGFSARSTKCAGLVLCAVLVLFALSLDEEAAPWFKGWRAILPAVGAAATVAMAVYLGMQIREQAQDARVMVRNFYGALRVHDTGPETSMMAVRTLTHGTINHGEEYLNIARRRLPTTYYGPNTGWGSRSGKSRSRARCEWSDWPWNGDHRGLRAAGRLLPLLRNQSIGTAITKGQFYFVPMCAAKLEIAMVTRDSLWRKRRRRISTCWRWTHFQATPFRYTCSPRKPCNCISAPQDGWNSGGTRVEPVPGSATGVAGKRGRWANWRVVDTDDDDTQDIFGRRGAGDIAGHGF